MADRLVNTLDEGTLSSLAKKRRHSLTLIRNFKNFVHIDFGYADDAFITFIALLLKMRQGSIDSFYDLIVPSDKSFTIRIRLSNHSSQPECWKRHDGGGRPDMYVSIWLGKFLGRAAKKEKTSHPLIYTVDEIPVIEYGFNERLIDSDQLKYDFIECIENIFSITEIPNYNSKRKNKRNGAYKPQKKIK